MNIYKITAIYLLSAVLLSCDDPNIIGVDLPGTSKFTINNDSIEHFTIKTISEDSLRSDESQSLLLGEIDDPVFGKNKGSFCTQILLPYNNISTIDSIVVDSVFLTYNISSHYGDLNESEDLEVGVYQISQDIYKDSDYYSSYSFDYSSVNLAKNEFIYEGNENNSAYINIQLENSFGEMIIQETGGVNMIDNVNFLNFFKGLYVEATASNTILYLNPAADKSKFSIYYHAIGVDSAVSLDFPIGGDAARINLFNKKEMNSISPAINEVFIQSMAGYKAEFNFTHLENIQSDFIGKAINRVTLDFECIEDANYPAHEKIYLVREKLDCDNDPSTLDTCVVFLKDFTIEGDQHFGGSLNNNNIYSFNITRYFVELLTNDEYTNKLYVLPILGAANANRTILDKDKISINIIYTEI